MVRINKQTNEFSSKSKVRLYGFFFFFFCESKFIYNKEPVVCFWFCRDEVLL